jgi:type II secretory pathway component GspD/PulD (secretin)
MHSPYDKRCSAAGGKRKLPSWRMMVPIWSAVIAALLSVTLRPAAAETQIRRQADDIYLRAENASIREVLAALSAEFNLTYKLGSNSERTVTGVYSGPLQQILVRVLESHDYFIKNLDDRIEVVVLGASSMSAQPSPIAALAPPAVVNGGRPAVAPPASLASVAPNSVGRPVAGPTVAANRNTDAPAMAPLKPNMPR